MIDVEAVAKKAEESAPSVAELEELAQKLLDRQPKSYVESAFIFARFVRDHGSDGRRLAEVIEKIAAASPDERDGVVAEALVMIKGVRR